MSKSGAAIGTGFELLAPLVAFFASSVSFASGPASVAAPEPSPARRLYVGAGALAHNLGEYSHDPEGGTGFVTSVYPELVVTGRFPLARFPSIKFLPDLTFTPLGRKSPEGGETTRILRLAARAARELPLGRFTADVFLGPGLLNWFVSGSGGTVTLNNGNTTTEFGLPSGTSASRLFFWETGGAIQYGPFRWESSLFVTGLLSSRRAVSFATQIGFGVL